MRRKEGWTTGRTSEADPQAHPQRGALGHSEEAPRPPREALRAVPGSHRVPGARSWCPGHDSRAWDFSLDPPLSCTDVSIDFSIYHSHSLASWSLGTAAQHTRAWLVTWGGLSGQWGTPEGPRRHCLPFTQICQVGGAGPKEALAPGGC